VEIAMQLDAEGFGICLGNGVGLKNEKLAQAISTHARNENFLQTVSELARKMVDGLGAQRIVSQMQDLRIVA
jgi:hypothetical protein